MKIVTWILLIVGAFPLAIYPAVLIADVMSLAGESSGKEPMALRVVATAFLLGSLAYPVAYLLCAGAAVARMKQNRVPGALAYSSAPLLYVGFLVLLLVVWSFVGK